MHSNLMPAADSGRTGTNNPSLDHILQLPLTPHSSVPIALEIGSQTQRPTLLNLIRDNGPITTVRLVADISPLASTAEIVRILDAVTANAALVVRAFPTLLEFPEVVAGIRPALRVPSPLVNDAYTRAIDKAYSALHAVIQESAKAALRRAS